MIERALYMTKASDLKHYDSSFSRIYFGNEFCQLLAPSSRELAGVISFVADKGLDFTFITPYAADSGLEAWKPLLRMVADEVPRAEIVFNDWGFFQLIKEISMDLQPVMGRLLNKMKRGPRWMVLADVLPPECIEYLKGSNLDVPAYQSFLARHGVTRVEMDNVLQGNAVNLSASGLRGSLYIPYAYVTTTRLCLANSCKGLGQDEVAISGCRKECRKYTFTLRHPVMPVPLISRGNTKFLCHGELPEDLEQKGIDRIVHEPEVPM